MFVHISPDVESFGETVSTMKFAERVSSVELGAARSNKGSFEGEHNSGESVTSFCYI
jgi:kinesin family protein C2/C3